MGDEHDFLKFVFEKHSLLPHSKHLLMINNQSVNEGKGTGFMVKGNQQSNSKNTVL
jgi:hypothetical protein